MSGSSKTPKTECYFEDKRPWYPRDDDVWEADLAIYGDDFEVTANGRTVGIREMRREDEAADRITLPPR